MTNAILDKETVADAPQGGRKTKLDKGTASSARYPLITFQHRCDSCGAAAYGIAYKDSPVSSKGEPMADLLFCMHHLNKFEYGLLLDGFNIEDHSWKLYESTKPDGGSAAG